MISTILGIGVALRRLWLRYVPSISAIRLAAFRALMCYTLWVATWAGAAHASPPNNLSFRHVLPDQVESLGHITAIASDRQGFVWFGGSSGLARYDGYNLKIFRHQSGKPRSLSHNTINRILVDRLGRLWIATEEGLSEYVAETDDFNNHRHSAQAEDSAARNSMRAMAEDPQGQIWLGTSGGLQLFDPASGTFTHFDFAEQAPSRSGNMALWDIAHDGQNGLWLASQTRGLIHFDQKRKQFAFYSPAAAPASEVDVRAVYIDRQERLWLGTYQGDVYHFDRETAAFHRFQHSKEVRKDVIWSIWQDARGQLWVGDGGGLNYVSTETGGLHRYAYSEAEPSGPGNYAVRALHEDAAGDLWLGYFPSGVDRLDWQASAFRNFRHLPHEENSLTDGGVLAAVEDQSQNLWIGTAFGLTYYNRSAGTFERFFHDPNDANSILGNTVLSLLVDSQNHLWIGSWSKGISKLDLVTGDFQRYTYSSEDATSLLGVEPWRIIEDSRGDIWVASELGISRYNAATDDFSRFLPEEHQMGGDARLYTRELYEDSDNNLWVGSDRGLYRLDRDSGGFTQYAVYSGDGSISADLVAALLEDSHGNFWVGTQGGGLNLMDRETGMFTSFGVSAGLPNDVITGIIEDDQNNLWITTQGGISRFSIDQRQFKNFDKRHGLLDNLFNRNTPLTTSWGELFFGSTKGFTLLDPRVLTNNAFVAPVVITEFEIFNRPVVFGEEDSPFSESIGVAKHITLKHTESVFSFEFAALSYRLPEQNQYAYQLEGFDTEWHHVGNKRTATYTNLDPGEYVFKVKAASSDGVWNLQGRSVGVTILPPPWKTWWAYCLYALFAVFLLVLLMQTKLRRMELVQEKQVNARLRKLDKVKDSFLANTSHELRTPLNGMIGIAEALMDDTREKISPEGMKKLEMIRASGKRLANLVNDILDYAKLTEHSLDIKLRPVKVHSLVHEVGCLLRPLAEAKNIELCNNVAENAPWIMADENRLQQILINLVGNAIKFTDHGYVEVALQDLGQYLQLEIRDTGMGIKEEDISSVFVAFHQLEMGDASSAAGTGLGLAITKQLVDLQGGEIGVSSRYGEGTVFSFTLAKATEQQEDNRRAMPAPKANIRPFINPSTRRSGAPKASEIRATVIPMVDHPEQYTVLVVDDDPVNRIVLSGILQQHKYQIVEANNGAEALAALEGETAVDLVILDVMMPRMNGFEVCQTIRQRFAQHELPVLFLTAQKVDDDLQQGFAVGGSEFLTKPVSKYELLALVANHLRLLSVNRKLRSTVNQAS